MPRRTADPAHLLKDAQSGSRVALARLLTLVEGGGDPAREAARLVYRTPGEAYTVGITGPPGAGKSTLTSELISVARAGSDVAVLAIDPTSPLSGGAILGDRVRMQAHALDEGVYIRSMATRGHLGGLALAVPDAVRALSVTGFPTVLVETVGVGQVEVDVASATDTTVVVVNPGWGDAVQANKAGLLEIADLFVINKSDRPGARETRRDLEAMLDLSAPSGWRPPIVDTVASTGQGVDDLWDAIQGHRAYLVDDGRLADRRRQRIAKELTQIVTARLRQRIAQLSGSDGVGAAADQVAGGEVDPYEAADRLLRAVVRGSAS